MCLSGWLPPLGYTRTGIPTTNTVVGRVKGRVEKEVGVALACKLTLWFKCHLPSWFLPLSASVGTGKVHKACPAPPALLLAGKDI